jgi:quinol monooxygenase YgiN
MLTRLAFQGTCLLAVLLIVPARAADEEKENPILAHVKTRVKDQKKPFTLVIRLRVKEGLAAKFEETFAKAAKATRAEKGCITYDLNHDTEDSARYVVYERWKSVDALESHLKSDHIKALLKALPELIDGAPEPRVLIPAAE